MCRMLFVVVAGRLRLVGLVMLISLFSGCASVPMATDAEDRAARMARLAGNQSAIYVYRHENFGSAMRVSLKLNGKDMGMTAPKTYFYWKVAPGKHKVSCHSENDRELVVEAKAGKATYVWQEMNMGFATTRCSLHLVTEQKGRQEMADCKLAKPL